MICDNKNNNQRNEQMLKRFGYNKKEIEDVLSFWYQLKWLVKRNILFIL